MRSLNASRKGLSNVVSVLVVILLSAFVASSLAFVITQFTALNLSPQSCAITSLNPSLVIQKTKFDKDSGELELTVKRNSESKFLTSFSIDLSSNGEKFSQFCSTTCSSCTLMAEGETKIYKLTTKNKLKPDSIRLIINNCPTQVINTEDIV